MTTCFYKADYRSNVRAETKDDNRALTVHKMMKVGTRIRWQGACAEKGLIEASIVKLPAFATGVFQVQDMDDGRKCGIYIEQIKEIRLTPEEYAEWMRITKELTR